MNSLVRFITENGGYEYNIIYPLNMFKGNFCSGNTTCVWYNNELLINTRITDYVKLFQSREIKTLQNFNIAQTYFFSEDGFTSRNLLSKFCNGNVRGTKEVNYNINHYLKSYYKGLEDCRLVVWNNKLYTYGTRWDVIDGKGCMCLYELNDNMKPINEIVMPPQSANTNCEKNWAAVEDRPFTFVYNHNPLMVVYVNKDNVCQLIKEKQKDNNINFVIKGSTQIVRYDENMYMSLIHTNNNYDDKDISHSDYLTAFVFYDNNLNIIKISDLFVFKTPMCEFTCGLAIHDDNIYITYSQLDCSSHLLVTDKNTIEKFLNTKSDNLYSFSEFYNLAKLYENERQFNTSSALYNYAAIKGKDENVDDNTELECIIKTYCGIVSRAHKFQKKTYNLDIINTLMSYTELYPEYCEFYYLISVLYRLMGILTESNKYKHMGDERKTNIHSYFFKYFNPNYL